MSDLIDRQAAIDYFVLNVGFHDEDGYPIEDTDELRKIWTEYFDGIPSEPHWIPVTEDTPDEERECWITPKTTSKVYRGIFTRHYGECHRTGFICDEGFMWLNTALAWMYCEVPEPYKGVTE